MNLSSSKMLSMDGILCLGELLTAIVLMVKVMKLLDLLQHGLF